MKIFVKIAIFSIFLENFSPVGGTREFFRKKKFSRPRPDTTQEQTQTTTTNKQSCHPDAFASGRLLLTEVAALLLTGWVLGPLMTGETRLVFAPKTANGTQDSACWLVLARFCTR